MNCKLIRKNSLFILLLLCFLATACGKEAPEPIPTIIPYVPEPQFERDAAVFGEDVIMTDLSEYAGDFQNAGTKVRQGIPDLDNADMKTVQNILQGKNVRLIRLDDTLKILNIGNIGLGRFGLHTWNLNEKKARILADMDNCRALVYYDSGNWPLSENIVWPYLRSLSVTSSQLSKWETPISELFPELRELIIRYDMIESLDLVSLGLPETLESIEIDVGKDSIREVPALYTELAAKNIPSLQFINGKAAGRFDPVIPDQQKSEYEKNLQLSRIISKANEALMENRGKIAKQVKPEISMIQLPKEAKIMCIHEKDLSSCLYDGSNEIVRNSIVNDPEECDVLFIESSSYVTDPNVRVLSSSSSGSSEGTVAHSLTAVDMVTGEIYYDTMYFSSFIGAASEEQKRNNALFQEKGLWGFIEQLF